MKQLLTILFALTALTAAAQKPITVIDTLQFRTGTAKVGKIATDTALADNDNRVLVGEAALRAYIANHAGSGGGGSYEPVITAPHMPKYYWNGYKNFVEFNADSIPDGTAHVFWNNNLAGSNWGMLCRHYYDGSSFWYYVDSSVVASLWKAEHLADSAAAAVLPDQTGQSGTFLTTNGTTASWGTIGNVDWSHIINHPYVPSGYGTVDASPTSGSANFITSGGVYSALGGYLPLTGGTLTGTAGSGYVGFPAQSATPSTPSSGFYLYANSAGKFSWIGTNGYWRVFDGTANTGNRSYTLPDTSGTVGVSANANNWTNANTFTSYIYAGSNNNLTWNPSTNRLYYSYTGSPVFNLYAGAFNIQDSQHTAPVVAIANNDSLGYATNDFIYRNTKQSSYGFSAPQAPIWPSSILANSFQSYPFVWAFNGTRKFTATTTAFNLDSGYALNVYNNLISNSNASYASLYYNSGAFNIKTLANGSGTASNINLNGNGTILSIGSSLGGSSNSAVYFNRTTTNTTNYVEMSGSSSSSTSANQNGLLIDNDFSGQTNSGAGFRGLYINIKGGAGAADRYLIRADTTNGTTPVKEFNVTTTGNVTATGTASILHLIGNSSTPTIVAGTAAGSSPTVSVSGTDIAGVITVTTGTSTTTGVLATVTFSTSYGSAPTPTSPAPANAATASLSGAYSCYYTSTAGTLVLNSGSSALANSTTYKFYYHTIQ